MDNFTSENALYLGNLHHAIPIGQLKQRIVAVFEKAGFSLQRNDVLVKRTNQRTYAFVFLNSSVDVVRGLQLIPHHPDVDRIQNPGEAVVVERKKERPQNVAALEESRREERGGSNDVKSRHDDQYSSDSSTSSSQSFTMAPQQSGHSYRTNQRNIPRDFTPSCSNKRHRSPSPPTTASDSVVAQAQRVAVLRNKKGYYIRNEKLGSETRHVEYKAAQGNFLKNQLQDVVGRYICAFLNSDGGTLVLGVQDNGYVIGVSLSHHEEDIVRQKIDGVITHMIPHVFPSMYKVQFTPVMDELGCLLENLKVVEINVVKGANTKQLYQSPRGEVYIRRDGSVQGPLKAAEIQAWTKIMMEKEHATAKAQQQPVPLRNDSREVLHQELRRLKEEKNAMTQKTDVMEQELKRLKEENVKLIDDRKKVQSSKICVIM